MCAVDASDTGFGVVETEWPHEHVRACGVWDDRWRFRSFAGSVPAREQALEAGEPPGLGGLCGACPPLGSATGGAVLCDPATVIAPTSFDDWHLPTETDKFPDVPLSPIRSKPWEVVKSGKWKHKEAIHMLEARAVPWSVRRRARRLAGHGTRFLHLGDSMSVCLAFAKGRAHDYHLLTVVRRTNMYLLATGMGMSLRWVPGEYV